MKQTEEPKKDLVLMRRVLGIVHTKRCYLYEGKYYEYLGPVCCYVGGENQFSLFQRVVEISLEKNKKNELAFSVAYFTINFKHVTDPHSVMEEFRGIYKR